MKFLLDRIRRHLLLKITIPIAFILFASIFAWSIYHLDAQDRFARDTLIRGAERVSNTVKMGLHYAMMLNSREDIRAIVDNYSKLQEVRGIRIIDKKGDVMFADHDKNLHTRVPQQAPVCQVCHARPEPRLTPSLDERIYKARTEGGEHILYMVSPILNEPACSSASGCHFHTGDEKILGVLDISFSMGDGQTLLTEGKRHTVYLALLQFGFAFVTLFFLVFVLIKRPINRIIRDTKAISQGQPPVQDVKLPQDDEIGQLAESIFSMGSDLVAKNEQLQLQKNIYRDLFEGVPCLVTVQNRDYKLVSFNRLFGERFSAKEGDYCYKAYKNRDSRCPSCPVERTFSTGLSQTTEEYGYYKGGAQAHWIVNTSPIFDGEGNIVAVMEMCLDITQRKQLEEALKESEQKYCDIFNNIPNAVLALDQENFSIVDCNKSATVLYDSPKDRLLGINYIDLFVDGPQHKYKEALQKGEDIYQAKQTSLEGREFFVRINSAYSGFSGRKMLLVTASDITQRLETEQQLIQASKMATLGEMATGVAHEINQPLSVIQTSNDLLKRSLSRGEMPAEALLQRTTQLVSTQIDRATKIIGHMREFGRKPEMQMEEAVLNDVMRRAFEFFGQQLALRSIEVVWELDERMPPVLCEPSRMEQVFINLFINARDAIEERAAKGDGDFPKRITVKTMHNHSYVTVRISDTGVGVPQAIVNRIFEPFFTTKQVGKGTGLGLSISYRIVQDHGGTINVTNNTAGGASFHIRIPVPRESKTSAT